MTLVPKRNIINLGTMKWGESMEKRDLNVSFYKVGAGIGTRITLPKPWLAKLGITQDEREVELILDEEKQQLIICKKK